MNSFTETERNLHDVLDGVRKGLHRNAAGDALVTPMRRAPSGASPPPPRLQPLAPVPGSTYAVAMGAGPATTPAQRRVHAHLLKEITRAGRKGPRACASPGAAVTPLHLHEGENIKTDLSTRVLGEGASNSVVEKAESLRLQHEASKVQRRNVRLMSSDAPAHSLAPFMRDITSYVQTQLQKLDARFADVELSTSGTSSGSLLPVEIRHKRTGCSEPTREEVKRRLRLEIFLTAERMFAECFTSYRLFLDAIADEHQSYVKFLEDDLTLHKEALLGMRDVVTATKQEAARLVAEHDAERERAVRQLQSEHRRLLRWRQQSEEDAVRERTHESDLKKELMTLENHTHEQAEEIKRLQAQVDALTRQNDSLSIGTFSDHLESANHLISELRAQVTAKDEALAAAHDEFAELAKDLRALADHYQQLTDSELGVDDVGLSVLGQRVLFPELARQLRLKKSIKK